MEEGDKDTNKWRIIAAGLLALVAVALVASWFTRNPYFRSPMLPREDETYRLWSSFEPSRR
jgi:hypothetical protein